MTAKKLLFRNEAHAKILRGIDVLANAVRITLGPKARTVVLERPYGAPTVINSGVAVAKEIELPDPFENMGAQLVRQVAVKTSEVAGDGTTTATLLAQAIVREGMKYVAAGMNPMDLKRGIDKAVAAIVDALKQLYRHYGADGLFEHDVVAERSDPQPGEPLLEQVMAGGKRLRPLPTLTDTRERARTQLARLPKALTGLENQALPRSLFQARTPRG